MSAMDIDDLHEAASCIEVNGEKGYHTVGMRYGYPIANALLVAHKRHEFGSMDYPDSENFKQRVNEALTPFSNFLVGLEEVTS